MASTVRWTASLILAFVAASCAPVATAATQLWASSLGVSPSQVSLSSINPSVGTAGTPFNINGGPGAGCDDLAGDPFWQGLTLWGLRNPFTSSSLAAWNPVSKTFVFETPTIGATSLRALAIDPADGRFYATSSMNLYTLDPTTGNATLVGPTVIGSIAIGVTTGLAFDGAGRLYGVAGNSSLVSIDKITGATTQVATMNVTTMYDMAWRAETGTMLGIALPSGSSNYSLFAINLATGALSNLGSSMSRPSGLAFTGLAADFDGSGTVGPEDFSTWLGHAGTATGATAARGDANGDGAVDGADLLAVQRQLGSTLNGGGSQAVPEPGGEGAGGRGGDAWGVAAACVSR